METLDRDPAGLTKLTRCTLTPLIEAVLDRNGTIDRMTPDGFTPSSTRRSTTAAMRLTPANARSR
jgi:hypothetical protein